MKGFNNVIAPHRNSLAHKFGFEEVELEESLGLNHNMQDDMYKLGFSKENILIFSKESNIFLIIEEVLKEINSKFHNCFTKIEPFEITDFKEIELILAKLKINLLLSFNHKDYQKGDDYLNYINNYKKEIANLRDITSKEVRNLIKLYSTLCYLKTEDKIIIFSNYGKGSD